MTVGFFTLGCKVNQADSDAISAHMLAAGYSSAPPETADIVVVNSCTVTAESDRKTRQTLRRFREVNRGCVLVLTGCAVQVGDDLIQQYPEVDLILGQRDIHALARYVDEFLLHRHPIVHVALHQRDEVFAPPGQVLSSTRATLKIQDGCDHFCTYCIIPHARGPVRSKPLDDVRRDAQTLVAQGFQEIVLVGINLAAYGKGHNHNLGDAVLAVAESGVARIRLGSLEPDLLNESILKTLSRVKILCPHFHLSLQSGCDTTLKRMGRRYDSIHYASLVNQLRNLFPNVSITTDLMVGFPGETEQEHAQSLAFVEQMAFSKVHVFPFSPRPRTPAATFKGQLIKAEKRQRSQQAISLAESLNNDFLATQVGQTLEVLLEQPAKNGGMQGYSANYCPIVVLDATPTQQNQFVQILVSHVNGERCTGTLLR
ncbi:MAG: tRNA (N(6)-L-threonylcarbamoyladenosine(37)-C(2))-methylthiotransferase MtaB [Oscillospiraceae bacterium]|nr:tRNA (N(6)-L-threonylcarbamoyladenosine(37)-C(2))-methylthiotransferase MtaB [Oscillospiraceae bacterium]